MSNQQSLFELIKLDQTTASPNQNRYIFTTLDDLCADMKKAYAPILEPKLTNAYLADGSTSLTFSISIPLRAGFSWEIFEIRFQEESRKYKFFSAYHITDPNSDDDQAGEDTIFSGSSKKELVSLINQVLKSLEYQGQLQREYRRGLAISNQDGDSTKIHS